MVTLGIDAHKRTACEPKARSLDRVSVLDQVAVRIAGELARSHGWPANWSSECAS